MSQHQSVRSHFGNLQLGGPEYGSVVVLRELVVFV